LDEADPQRLALLSLDYEGKRAEWSFLDVLNLSSAFGGWLLEQGIKPGDTVMMLLGSRPEWVLAMLGTWRIGAVALPCHASLRPHDIAVRAKAAQPKLVICDPSTRTSVGEALPNTPILELPAEHMQPGQPLEPFTHAPAPAAELSPTDPALVIFTSGTTSEPVGVVHGVRWLAGQNLQAREWFAAPAGSLAWCTSAPGWSKSSRNVFLAPWLCGASAMIHDGRFDPAQRLDLLKRERVAALCQAPTEYRVMAAQTEIPDLPDLKSMVAAGEALDPAVIAKFEDATGVRIRDGYGQTETGHLAAVQPGVDCPAGSMGRPLPGIEAWIEDGELVVEASTIPTLFLRTLDGEEAPASGPWHTGDLVREEDGFLFFEGRNDDIISSAGYRIGPFEVESALSTHPAVAECAAVAAPDAERGSVVRAAVVLKPDFSSSPELAAELQEHVKAVTAPYKYPRIVDFVDALPKTTTGKVRRAELRGEA
jgi:acetyl-CoA synthetase